MTISNEELEATLDQMVAKGLISSAALATGGKLNPAQANKFIDYVIDETTLAKDARIVRFRNEEALIDKIGVGKWVMIPKEEASDPRFRRGVQTTQIRLQPRDVIVPFEITDRFKRHSIEGDNAEDTVVRLMATTFANNLELLYSNGDALGPAIIERDFLGGDEGSATEYMQNITLAMFDGWLRQADVGGHVQDFEGDGIGLDVFGAMKRELPTKFRRKLSELRYYLSSDLHQLYIEFLSGRATALGDAATGGISHKPYGIQIAEVPLWDSEPEIVEHITLAATGTVALRYKPISNVVVTKSTLGKFAEPAYTEGPDYTVNEADGEITRVGGAIGDPELVKVTYTALPQVLLTHRQNLIVAIGLDIMIEKQRNIYTTSNEYAITASVDVTFEEKDALVKGTNIALEAATP